MGNITIYLPYEVEKKYRELSEVDKVDIKKKLIQLVKGAAEKTGKGLKS